MTYSKFVIVSDQRTGSTLLQMLLASHTEIVCRGELLNPNDAQRRIVFPDHDPTLSADDDPIMYLQNTLYAELPESVRAVGFRMHYSHGRCGVWKKARDAIVNDKNVRIVHLRRENLLDRYLSSRLAARDDEWIATNDARQSQQEPIVLDLEDCVKNFTRCEWFQDEANRIFSAHPKIDLSYEDLCSAMDSETRRLLQFLGVEFQTLQSPTKRQRKKKKCEVIENYEELKSLFDRGIEKGWSQPRWLGFFDDNWAQ